MGTHNYLVEVVKSFGPLGRENLKLSRVNIHAVNSYSTFLWHDNVCLLLTHGCREALTNAARDYLERFSAVFGTLNMLFAFRCFGEQYTSVQRLMNRYKNSAEILSNFFSEMFRFKMSIDSGRISESQTKTRLVGPYKVLYRKGEKTVVKLNSGYITIYIESRDLGDTTIKHIELSALTGILREPKIIRKILRGEIKTREELCKELIILAHSRLMGRDSSYFSVKLSEEGSLPNIKASLKRRLSNPENYDGSDWCSILALSNFIFSLPVGNSESLKFIDGVASYTLQTGGVLGKAWNSLAAIFPSASIKEDIVSSLLKLNGERYKLIARKLAHE